MNKLHLIILLMCMSWSLNAQFSHDKLILTNSTQVQGFLITDTLGNYVLKDIKGNTLHFSVTDIADYQKIIHRYISYTGAGMIYGSAANEKPVTLSVLSEHNIQFYNYFAVGGLIGTELINELTVPLAVNAKFYLPFRNKTWYLNMSLGHSFSVEKPQSYYEEMKGSGGILAMAELGLLIPLNYHSILFFTLGYRYNELHYKYENWYYGETERTYYYNRISMRFGVCLY